MTLNQLISDDVYLFSVYDSYFHILTFLAFQITMINKIQINLIRLSKGLNRITSSQLNF